MNNNNINNINNNNNMINIFNNSRKKFYILKIDDEVKLNKIHNYLKNLGNADELLCTEEILNNTSIFWLLIEFQDRFKLINELVDNSIFYYKAYHKSDFYNYVLSKGPIKKLK